MLDARVVYMHPASVHATAIQHATGGLSFFGNLFRIFVIIGNFQYTSHLHSAVGRITEEETGFWLPFSNVYIGPSAFCALCCMLHGRLIAHKASTMKNEVPVLRI